MFKSGVVFIICIWKFNTTKTGELTEPKINDEVIAETNQGYTNSQIPVTVSKFCIEAATLNESDTSNLLHDFSNMKHNATALRWGPEEM